MTKEEKPPQTPPKEEFIHVRIKDKPYIVNSKIASTEHSNERVQYPEMFKEPDEIKEKEKKAQETLDSFRFILKRGFIPALIAATIFTYAMKDYFELTWLQSWPFTIVGFVLGIVMYATFMLLPRCYWGDI